MQGKRLFYFTYSVKRGLVKYRPAYYDCAKPLLLLVATVTFSIAAINGRVTDATGTNAISGALVQLENGNQQVITDGNGAFALTTTGAVIRSVALPQQRLLATLRNDALLLNSDERRSVEITVCDISGRIVSRVLRRTIDAGVYAFTFPIKKSGVVLYRISTDCGEFILKGQMVGGTFTNAAKTTVHTMSTDAHLQQSKTTASFNDVIAVVKEGFLNYRQKVTNADTSGMVITMLTCAGTIADGDGNVYQTVAIGKQTWTTENLRATKFMDGTPITSEYWDYNIKEPRCCFSGFRPDAKYIKKYGALYNWYVVNPASPKKIAPAGWHVPSNADWDTLQEYLTINGYNYDGTTVKNRVAKSLAAQADWPSSVKPGAVGNDLTRNNRTGFSAFPSGSYTGMGDFNSFYDQGIGGGWWSATDDNGTYYDRSLYSDYEQLIYHICSENTGKAIRLVKD